MRLCLLSSPSCPIALHAATIVFERYGIGDRKDNVCLHIDGQNSSSPYAAISAMLDSEGRAFVLIQVLYRLS